jgi:hypothetical protein
MVLRQWRKEKVWKSLVLTVGKALKPLASRPSIARIIVSRMQDVKVASIILKKYALFALNRLLPINMPVPKPVAIVAVENCSSETEMVYNLTTEHGCYYANNVLASNCDADRYVTMYLAKAQKVHMGRDATNSAKMPDDIIKRREWLIKGGSSRFGA